MQGPPFCGSVTFRLRRREVFGPQPLDHGCGRGRVGDIVNAGAGVHRHFGSGAFESARGRTKAIARDCCPVWSRRHDVTLTRPRADRRTAGGFPSKKRRVPQGSVHGGRPPAVNQLDAAMAQKLSAIAPAPSAGLVASYQMVIANHDTICDALLDQAVSGLVGTSEG